MTQENILDQAKKLVGMAYGWGDSNGDMDCSSTMNAFTDVLESFCQEIQVAWHRQEHKLYHLKA